MNAATASIGGSVGDSKVSAKAAGLRYVTDRGPGIARRHTGARIDYIGPDGAPLTDRTELSRIKALAIPPAWRDVWICPSPNGHIQATGRDAKGRKQYRYHPRWREVRDEVKYDRMVSFGRGLPALRAQVERDLARPGLPQRKVLAALVRLLETTLIRVGNEEYARQNDSFGLTTMRDRHVNVSGSAVRFRFKGKSGKEHEVDVMDRRLAAVIKRSQDLPGYELFQYLDGDGARRTIESADVNAYIRDAVGGDFTAKDFRTWAGTVLAARALQELAVFGTKAQARRNVLQAVESVAKRLGNTKTVCRKCYIHPAVIHAYLDGSLLRTLARRAKAEIKRARVALPAEEAAVLSLLQARLLRDANGRRSRRRQQRGSLQGLLRRSLRHAMRRA